MTVYNFISPHIKRGLDLKQKAVHFGRPFLYHKNVTYNFILKTTTMKIHFEKAIIKRAFSYRKKPPPLIGNSWRPEPTYLLVRGFGIPFATKDTILAYHLQELVASLYLPVKEWVLYIVFSKYKMYGTTKEHSPLGTFTS